jgi:hypothetical protein
LPPVSTHQEHHLSMQPTIFHPEQNSLESS